MRGDGDADDGAGGTGGDGASHPAETRGQRRERLLATVARLPTAPGVYLFRNDRGAVAYVGKARNLRERVRSYFNRNRGDSRRAV